LSRKQEELGKLIVAFSLKQEGTKNAGTSGAISLKREFPRSSENGTKFCVLSLKREDLATFLKTRI